MTKATVHVTLKNGVLDPQGKAIQNALENLGFSGINGVRQGKFIELDLSETNREIIQVEVTDMCEKLIANTVIETYKVEVTD